MSVITALERLRQDDLGLEASPCYVDSVSKQTRPGGSKVEHLPSKDKALSSKPQYKQTNPNRYIEVFHCVSHLLFP
jgi:hypothetical protein